MNKSSGLVNKWRVRFRGVPWATRTRSALSHLLPQAAAIFPPLGSRPRPVGPAITVSVLHLAANRTPICRGGSKEETPDLWCTALGSFQALAHDTTSRGLLPSIRDTW